MQLCSNGACLILYRIQFSIISFSFNVMLEEDASISEILLHLLFLNRLSTFTALFRYTLGHCYFLFLFLYVTTKWLHDEPDVMETYYLLNGIMYMYVSMYISYHLLQSRVLQKINNVHHFCQWQVIEKIGYFFHHFLSCIAFLTTNNSMLHFQKKI